MFCAALIFVLILPAIKSNDTSHKRRDSVEKGKMMGIETMREVRQENPIKIDKDTIITKNLKLGKKVRNVNKNGPQPGVEPDPEPEPDWSYASFPPEVAVHAAQFKLNMSQCLKEVQDSDQRSAKRLSPGRDSPIHGDCLIACVLKRNGVIEKGKVNKGNLVTLVSKFYGKNVKMMKKLEKNLDRCVELSAGRDDCALAAKLNDCTNELMASNKHKLNVKY